MLSTLSQFLIRPPTGITAACATMTTSPIGSRGPEDVVCGERVASNAMGFAGVSGAGAIVPHDILARRDYFQMRGIHATSIPTQMVNLQVRFDWADQHSVSRARRTPSPLRLAVEISKNPRVPVGADGTGPVPARGRITRSRDFGNPINEVHRLDAHGTKDNSYFNLTGT